MQQDNNFELRKENFQLKQKNQKLEKKVEQAKQIMKDLLSNNADWTNKLEAEQFIKG